MNRTIKIEIRNVYGNETIYPRCHDADAFARIAGTKTLTMTTLHNVAALGYGIDVLDRYGNVARRYEAGKINALIAA